MIPFSPLMYPDDVVFFRSAPATGGQGASRRTFPSPGTPLKASVQSKSVDRTDRDGRVATVTLHVVRTATDPQAKADDKFEWLGRTLTVEGGSEPGGIGDVIWITPCLESK
jgi:hypothetical protein